MSFAQFEREVTAERIRDKIAASKKKGMWMGGLPPLGYDARDRSLVVNATEAETVRTLFDLYDRLGCVRAVKAEADHLRLVTKHRRFADGRSAGGVPFSRGRIYHLLSNPVYIGRIRHREKSHEGQHAAIIGQELWDQVQHKLTANAARARRKETRAEASPLAGKFRDETGDILTPSHAVKNGRRYRYYISRRLITRSGEGDLDGWRLPAPALEQAVTELIGAWLGRHMTPAELLQDASASRIAALRTRLGKLAEEQQNPRALCALIASGRVTPGHIALSLDRDALAQHLETDPGRIAPAALDLASELTLRRRGVETKLILDDAAPKVDQRLLRYIALGHAWFAEIKGGTAIHQIAERAGTTRQRISAIVELAFLAPDLVRAVADGRQPVGMISDRLIKTRLPMLWSDQRDLFAKD